MKVLAIKSDGFRIGLKFSFVAKFMDTIKQARHEHRINSAYLAKHKLFYIDNASAAPFVRFVLSTYKCPEAYISQIQDNIQQAIERQASDQKSPFIENLNITFLKTLQNELVVRISGFDPVVIHVLKQFEYRYNPKVQAWIIQDSLESVAQANMATTASGIIGI